MSTLYDDLNKYQAKLAEEIQRDIDNQILYTLLLSVNFDAKWKYIYFDILKWDGKPAITKQGKEYKLQIQARLNGVLPEEFTLEAGKEIK